MRFRVVLLVVVAFVTGIGSLSTPGYCPPSATASLGIDTREFARLVTGLSEPEGYFNSDNFISNEAGYLKILPLLRKTGLRDGVYLGVGPDQNYSYLAEIRPKLAFIVDIRRQNLLEHLYYKALFVLSSNRAEFLQRLFGRRIHLRSSKPAQPDITRLVALVDAAPRDAAVSLRNIQEAEQLIRGWSLGLSDDDFRSIEYVARALIDSGPELQFTSYSRAPRSWYPTYKELLLETDSAGRNVNYLASEDRFLAVRTLHRENRIVPVVADLAGRAAMSNIARELRARHLEVSCFYLSNVEFYLFGRQRWSDYVRNMRALPWAENAILIRSISNNWRQHPASIPGYYMTTVLQRVNSFFENEDTGRNASYWDLVTSDYIAPHLEMAGPKN
jgi:hypothetical protein